MEEKKVCHYKFFQNSACEFFPCHEVADPQHFNCLFCYCPLYALGKNCGGNFRYTADGIKDCSNCLLPHRPENYERILSRFQDLIALTKE